MKKSDRVEDLTNNSDLAVLSQGAKLLTQGSIHKLKSVGADLFGSGKALETEELDDEDESEADEEEDGTSYDGQMTNTVGSLDDNRDAEDGVDLLGQPPDDMAPTGLAMIDRMGAQRKTFQCDIHNIHLTNLGRCVRQ